MTSATENKIGLPPGAVVDGRYRVVRVLDLGGTGVVHQVEHVGTGRKLALKTLLDPANEGRLEQEARAASHLRNPHAVKIVDMGRAPDVGAYLVMELLEGTSLRALIDEVGQLPLDLVANVALQICECLDEAHAAGIVHRDLKPGNVHLAPTFGTHHHVTVLDFGAVKLHGPEIRSQISPQEDLTRVGSTVGTPFYMSLEQLRGNASVDAVSDVYSLCVVLYEMLTGTRPFQADSLGDLVYALVQTKAPAIASIRPDVPPDLADTIGRGLSPRREERPASARAIAGVLAPLGDPAYALWLRTAPPRGAAPSGQGAAATPPMAAAPAAAPLGAPRAPLQGAPPAPSPSTPGVASLTPRPAPSAPRAAPSSPGLGPPPAPGAPLRAAPAAPPLPPPPPAPSSPGPSRAAPPPPRPGLRPPTGGPAARPRPPDPRREPEHSALTALPSAAMARVTAGEQPTAALPITDALPDLLQDPTTSNAPTGQRPAPPPPRARQDTPTEMFQDAHGPGPASVPGPRPSGSGIARPGPSAPRAAPDDDDDDDGGRTRVAQDVAGGQAARPLAPPGIAGATAPARPARPDLGPPAGADDDNPTSILDLDALNEAARRKAAAGPATTPPPATGPAALGLPDLAPLGASSQALGGTGALGSPSPHAGSSAAGVPPGATETMRLDVESLSGPLPHARLVADAERAGDSFDPARISLVDTGPRSGGSPPGDRSRELDPAQAAMHGRPPVGAPGAPLAPPPPGMPSTTAPGKPAWQVQIDQGIAAVTAETREATARFLAWYRVLRPNEQIAFVAGTVLGFAIVVMLFILWLR